MLIWAESWYFDVVLRNSDDLSHNGSVRFLSFPEPLTNAFSYNMCKALYGILDIYIKIMY